MTSILRNYGLLIVLSVIWGLAFVAIRAIVGESGQGAALTPVNLTVLRWLIVSATFLTIYPFVVKPRTKFEWKDLPRLGLVAFANVAVYHLALNTAETSVDASLAGLLISFNPVFLVILSAAVLHESVGRRIWLALVVAFVGAAVISSPGLSVGSSGVVGPSLVVLAAFANAVYTITSKPLLAKYGPIAVSAWVSLLGTGMLLSLVSQGLVAQVMVLPPSAWEGVLYLALLSTVLSNTIYFTLAHGQQVSRLGIQLFLVPLVSAAGGVLILSEPLAWTTFLGGGMLLAAVALAMTSRR